MLRSVCLPVCPPTWASNSPSNFCPKNSVRCVVVAVVMVTVSPPDRDFPPENHLRPVSEKVKHHPVYRCRLCNYVILNDQRRRIGEPAAAAIMRLLCVKGASIKTILLSK